MASPLAPSKKTVDLGTGEVRVSRIRRDPPPKKKEVDEFEAKEREARNVVIGVIAFAVAICAILVLLASVTGWTPREVILLV